MPDDLITTVIIQQENADADEQEIIAGLRGRADYDLAAWAQAFKEQYPQLLVEHNGWETTGAYISLDLN